MFRDIELPFKLTLLEALSIVAFAAIGYSVIYKLGYYSVLDITWFMYELTPINIVFSSIIFITISLLSVGVGFLLYKLINSMGSNLTGLLIKLVFFIFFLLFFLTVFILTFPIVSDFSPIKLNIDSTVSRYLNLGVIYAFVTLFFFETVYIRPYNIIMNFQDLKFFTALVLTLFLVYPFLFGTLEGDYLIKNKMQSLSEVDIKDNKKWYLVHYFNDKFLLISGGEKNFYKIVEYKDVNHIASKANPRNLDL